MNNNRKIRKGYLFIIVFISTIIFSSTSMINGFTNTVNGQTNATQANSTNTNNLVNIQDIPLEKVRVGDIEMAYKMFGKGDPILLNKGVAGSMDAWEPAISRD